MNDNTLTAPFFGLQVFNSQHKDIRKLKRHYPTRIHGNKIWRSSLLAINHFIQQPLEPNTRVLELGCGWGLTGIFLNKTYDCPVTAIDADSDVFPYLQLHARANGAQITTKKIRFEKITTAMLAQFDVIVAADVCFWDELTQLHFNLIRRALKAGVQKIVYADPMREPFIQLSERCGEAFYAETEASHLASPNKAQGGLMIIENA